MTNLVTGGTGFIGPEVVRILLGKGEKSPLVFSRNPANNWRLADVADQVQFVSGDVGNYGHVQAAVKLAG